MEAMRPLVESTPGVRRRVKPNPHVTRLIADTNAQMAEFDALLVELGLINPDTGELVSSAEIDALVARARRRVEEDGREGDMP